MSKVMKRFIRIFSITVVLILIITLNVFAQNDFWDWPEYRMEIGKSAGELKFTLNGAAGLSSYNFVTKVGGVAFEAVATPEVSLKNKKIELTYDKSQTDGNRLAVSIDGKIYHPFLPDWELVPIARYANSKYNAAVSLFGDGYNYDKKLYKPIYHPDFNNTLLGLRLLQADLIFFDLGEFWQLPRLNQKTILGHGEERNSVSERDSRLAYQEISEIWKPNRQKYDSWVYTDHGLKVEFSVKDNDLKLSNSPYYYFWKSSREEVKKQLAEYERQMAEYKKQGTEYERQIAEYRRQADSLRKRGLTQQHNEVVRRHNEIVRKRDEVVRKHNEIVQKAKNLQPKVFRVDSLTDGMKAKNGSLYKYNPTVYDAAWKTMRFAAFFRYVKVQNNSSWQKFLKQINTVNIDPDVKTPTEWNLGNQNNPS